MPKSYYVKTFIDNVVSLYSSEEDLSFDFGDFVVVETKLGKDIGKILSRELSIESSNGRIIKKASKDEIEKFNINRKKSVEQESKIKEIIKKYYPDIHFVNCYFLIERKLLVNFSSESRIDFRELVKELAKIYKMRIEMRQISTRESFKIKGGIGICGMECCCSRFNHLKQHISANLVKDQGLSETNSKTIGPCGKLLCCLAYEADYYKEGKCILYNANKYEQKISDNT